MSNNLVNQSTKAISTNELRWIGPVWAVVSSGPMDLFFYLLDYIALAESFQNGNRERKTSQIPKINLYLILQLPKF